MEFMWLYSLCQCTVSVAVIVVSVRLCIMVSGERANGSLLQPGSVSCCLRLCLGWVGAVGGAVAVPVNVLLNLRTRQCFYTCIALVCSPLVVRQFTMFLLLLLTLDGHLTLQLADRYTSVMTRQRALCVVLLCWVCSVLSAFAQFIGSDVLDSWENVGISSGTAGHELLDNLTTSSPPSKYRHERMIIGQYLPYGGFLSKFYIEDKQNFTYAEIHSNHWGLCAPGTILSPEFLVYVHGVTVFMLPLVCLVAVYLELLCTKPSNTSFSHADPPKQDSSRLYSLALSLSLLVVLCLPLHIIHAVLLYQPNTNLPSWAHAAAAFLSQLYGLVPQVLFTPPRKQEGGEQASFPLAVPRLPPAAASVRGKSVRMVLCEAVQAAPWASAKHSLKAKVCPEV